MTEVKKPYQELFDYLSNELNCIATQTEMQEIEAILISKHEQQIKDAYNKGFTDGREDWEIVMSNETQNVPTLKIITTKLLINDSIG